MPDINFILQTRECEGQPWEDLWERTFPTGAEAQANAKSCNERQSSWGSLRRYKVKKIVDMDNNNFWAREAALNHKPVPWERSPYYAKHHAYMLPHVSPDNPHMIRFFLNMEHAVEGRYTSITVGRFLSNYEDIDSDEREDILVKMGIYSEQCTFGITTDPDKIIEIYENGPTSCMNDPDEYELPTPHPSIVYSKGDLALAYIERGDGQYSARAVVFPHEKAYTSVYGHYSLLKKHLVDEGYEQNERKFIGAKIGAIKSDDGDWLMPYIDPVSSASLSACGKYFILDDEGDWDCRNTEGVTYEV